MLDLLEVMGDSLLTQVAHHLVIMDLATHQVILLHQDNIQDLVDPQVLQMVPQLVCQYQIVIIMLLVIDRNQ